MSEGVYRVTEVIGVSSESWEAAARGAVETAAKTVRDLRIAEVLRQDVSIENGKIKNYRVRLAISFKYESGEEGAVVEPARELAGPSSCTPLLPRGSPKAKPLASRFRVRRPIT